MNSDSLKNVTTILVLCTIAFLGYYLFVQKDQTELTSGDGAVAELLGQVQKYIERNQQLQRISLNTEMLSDERFRSLTGYPTEIPEQPVGRENPFDRAVPSSNNF
jgi:hypothetical protein